MRWGKLVVMGQGEFSFREKEKEKNLGVKEKGGGEAEWGRCVEGEAVRAQSEQSARVKEIEERHRPLNIGLK